MVQIAAGIRSGTGKGVSRKLRREGRIPAVVYGSERETLLLDLDGKEFSKVFSNVGFSKLLDLKLAGETKTVLIKDVNMDNLRQEVRHVDFHQVRLDKAVVVQVPLILVGEDQRTKDGGVLQQVLRELEITCLPRSIPEKIEVDVSGLEIGKGVVVGDLVLPQGVETTIDDSETIASVLAPRMPEAEAEAEETEEVAPEAEVEEETE